jgi:hypothetical protein
MGLCANCGSGLAENSQFCGTCGTAVISNNLLPAGNGGLTIDVSPPSKRWYVTYATGQRGGPFTENHIQGLIARQELKITDSVVIEGGNTWIPITQSPFAQFIATQATLSRLASSTCPRCGGAMAVVLRRSGASKGFFILGLLTIWLFGFGVIFLIIGYITGRNPVPRYECPICKYKAR